MVMKILVLAPYPFYTEQSSAIMVRELTESLVEAGHEPHLITYGEGEGIDIPGCTVTRTGKALFFRSGTRELSRRKLARIIGMYRAASSTLKRKRFDIIHALDETTFVARRLHHKFDIPYVCHFDNYLPSEACHSDRLLTKMENYLSSKEQAAIDESRGTLTSCRYLESRVLAAPRSIPVQRLDEVPLNTETEGVEKTRKNTLRFSGEGITFLYAGSLGKHQDIDFMLQGFSLACLENESIRLAVVGGKPAEIRKYKRLATKLGIKRSRIRFLGTRPLKELPVFLEQADVLLSPRCSGNTVPLKLFSYLQAHKPIIAPCSKAHTQLLDTTTAFLVEPDATDLAAGIIELANSQELRDQLARQGSRKLTEKYSRHHYRRKLEDFYGSLAIHQE